MNSGLIRRMVRALFGSSGVRSCRSSGWAAEVLEERALPSPAAPAPLVLPGSPEVQQIATSPSQPALTKPVAAVVPTPAPSPPAGIPAASTVPPFPSLPGNGILPAVSGTTNAAGAAVVIPIGSAPGSPGATSGMPLFPTFGVSQVPVVNPGLAAAAPSATSQLAPPVVDPLVADAVFAGNRDWMRQEKA